ncbi:MAG: hypothetical protein GSR77_06385 [Desulfurococcales archaeon]|nr:hypothetical protein [Desulfurococcales archaeon]
MSRLIIRELSDPYEFIEAVEVQKSAWRMNDYREAAPAHLLRALADNGGLVLGAFLDNRLVGVSYGWPVYNEYFYSHATGVGSNVKYKGVGFELKATQRARILEKYGLEKAMWTFDPLQGLNSVFNLAKLGAIARIYLLDYYGEIRDSINIGLGTDRVKIEWYLTSRRVLSRLEKRCKPSLRRLNDMEPVISIKYSFIDSIPIPDDIMPVSKLLERDIVIVPIPRNVSSLREYSRELPSKWRMATREVYKTLIEEGYVLVDSIRSEKSGIVYNILWRADLRDILSGEEPWREC